MSGTGDLSNFPVLLTEANFLTAAFDNSDNGGGDIRFSSDLAGTTQLACEIVTWDNGATNKAEVWVKIPTLDGDAATDFYVWYGNTGQTQPAANDTYGSQNVWSQNYEGVYHLEGNYNDSSSNGYNMAPGNAPDALTSSKIGAGYSFTASSSDYVSVTPCANIVFEDSTIQCWFKPHTGCNGYFIGKGNSSASNYFALGWNGNFLYNSYPCEGNVSITKAANSWYFLVGTRNNTSNKKIFYINTDSGVEGAEATGTINFTTESAGMGRFGDWDNGYADGDLDEVRYSSEVRTSDWIATEYANQNDPATFVTESAVEALKDPISSGIIPFPR